MRSSRALSLCLIIALAGCDSAPSGVASLVSGVLLRFPHDSLFFGRTVHAVAVATGDPSVVDRARFSWSSSDTNVAIVDTLGDVTGVGPGNAIIAAQFHGQRAEFRLRVVMARVDGGVTFVDGSSHYGSTSCAVASDGGVYCRPAATTVDSVPAMVPMTTGGMAFSAVHTASGVQCALGPSSAIYCWGVNDDFVLGRRGELGSAPAVVSSRGIPFSQFSLGGHSTICGISGADSVLYCWGHSDSFQTGREPRNQADTNVAPVTGSLRARAISVANFHACAIDLTGTPWCWGANASPQSLGITDDISVVSTPHRTQTTVQFASVTVAESHQCALTLDGQAYCWGRESAALGTGPLAASEIGPRPVLTTLRFRSIAALGFPEATCGITLGNELYCWGAFRPGSLSFQSGVTVDTPVQVLPGLRFRALSPSLNNMCAITVEGSALCW